MATELGFEWIDPGEAARNSPLDGVHLDAEWHAAVADQSSGCFARLFV